jgi:hypothetical protein
MPIAEEFRRYTLDELATRKGIFVLRKAVRGAVDPNCRFIQATPVR